MKLKKVIITMLLSMCAFLCTAQGFVIVEGKTKHELNPQITSYSSDAQLLTGLYEGLFSYNPLTLEPDYAIASEYHVSRDKKRWTITLRKDAKFSNGEPITAAHVRDSFIKLLATPGAPYASMLDIIWGAGDFRNKKCSESEVGISVIDDYTLAVRLVSPANYLPKVLCHASFSVVHSDSAVYSGPYVLSEQTENTYVLKKNPFYWDAENVKLEEITFLQSEDEKENAYLFNTGKADWITNNVDAEALINKSSLQIGGEFGTAYYFFKLSNKNPYKEGKFNPWDYSEFRNAILEAIPWKELRANVAVPALNFVYPLTGYNSPDGFDYTDVAEAKMMMDTARRKYGILDDELLTLTFEISQFTLSEEKKDLLKAALLPLGVELVITEIPSYFYLSNVPYSSADMFAYTWIGDFADPLAFLELFRSNSSLNDSGWSDPQFDSLLERAASGTAYQRYEDLAQAEKILLDSGMVIPIYHPVSYNIINLNETGGWAMNAFDVHPLKYLYKKEVRTSAANVVMR
ncbi:MAG: peptide ABC transporter substrate-binding protein [Treponema sp.]|nr:peptide ABC transporter substrate-binding protein [Treponema sp.]